MARFRPHTFAHSSPGSERFKKGIFGPTARDGARLGASLNAFYSVISALNAMKTQPCHVPYRTSKLTRLLADGLMFGKTTGLYCVDLNSSL
jgi:hypothetical protein